MNITTLIKLLDNSSRAELIELQRAVARAQRRIEGPLHDRLSHVDHSAVTSQGINAYREAYCLSLVAAQNLFLYHKENPK